MKTIIAGSRKGFTYEDVVKAMKKISWAPTEILHLVPSGIEFDAAIYAKKKKIPVKLFFGEWKVFKKINKKPAIDEMVQYADALVLLIDNKSEESEYILKQALKKGLTIFTYSKQGELAI